MNSKQLEDRIASLILVLRNNGRYTDAAFAEFSVWMAKGYAPDLEWIYSELRASLDTIQRTNPPAHQPDQ